jgi:CRP-like cAMP-binding protein
MIEVHLRKLRKRDEIIAEEEAAIRGAMSEVREVRADSCLIRHGVELDVSMLLLGGWLARAKQMPDGQRQISELHVPGDFADLHSLTLKRLDHDVVTLTPCRIGIFPHKNLQEITANFPHLTRVYWFTTNMDASIHREWMVSIGRRSALERMAHLFCELRVRLEIAGLTDGDSYDFPLTQLELSECLGLTGVHVNRTLQELRRRELITLEARRATLLDVPALEDLAGFDPSYLYLEKRVR